MKFLRIASVLAFFLAGSNASPAQAQLVEIAKGAATSLAIQDIIHGLESLIGRAEAAGDFVLKRGAQEALYVIDAFKKANTDLLDVAFEKISVERQALINQLAETTNTLNSTVDLSLDAAEAMLDQVDRLARDVTFKNYPVIFRYRGSIVVPGETQNIRLTIQGASLTDGDPHILFRGDKYLARKSGESLLIEIPRDLFVPENRVFKSEDATLVLTRKSGGFLGFFQKTDSVSYDLNIVTLPHQLGKVELNYKISKTVPQEKSYSYEDAHNSSSRDWNCRSFAYSPATSDRRFDPDRSSVIPGSGNSRGQLRNAQVKDTGISFQLCAKRRITDKDNGFRHALTNYVEVWTETEVEENKQEMLLNWTDDVVLTAGERSDDLIARVTLFTGRSSALTKSGEAGGYADVSFDADQKLIIVRPKIPGDIRRL